MYGAILDWMNPPLNIDQLSLQCIRAFQQHHCLYQQGILDTAWTTTSMSSLLASLTKSLNSFFAGSRVSVDDQSNLVFTEFLAQGLDGSRLTLFCLHIAPRACLDQIGLLLCRCRSRMSLFAPSVGYCSLALYAHVLSFPDTPCRGSKIDVATHEISLWRYSTLVRS